jgi:hypothetical protein
MLTILVAAVVAHFATFNHGAAKSSVVALQLFTTSLSDGLFGGIAKWSLAAVGGSRAQSYEHYERAKPEHGWRAPKHQITNTWTCCIFLPLTNTRFLGCETIRGRTCRIG